MAGPSDGKDGKGKRKAPKPPPKPRRSDVDKRSLISRDGAATVSELFFFQVHTYFKPDNLKLNVYIFKSGNSIKFVFLSHLKKVVYS